MKRTVWTIVVSIVVSTFYQCADNTPLACPCQIFRIKSQGNNSPISGATLRVITPTVPADYGWVPTSPGEYAASHVFCRPQLIEYEVSRPGFRTRRLTHTPPFEVQGASSAQCATPRPPVIEITLESQ